MRQSKSHVAYPKEQSSRNPLLPFDEIVVRTSDHPKREMKSILNYMPSIMKQMKDRMARQQTKLSLLSKLNDPSYEQISFKESVTQIIENALSKRLQYFRPDSTFILVWNLFMLLAITFNFLEVPLSLFLTSQVYYSQFENQLALSLNIIFIIAFFFDTCLIRTNLAFYRNGKLIVKRSFIFANYLRYDFLFDGIAWLVYLIYIASGVPQLVYLKLLFYLKLSTMLKINDQILFALATYRVRLGIYKLLRIITILWFITTWVSSIYFSIDYGYYREKGFYYSTGQLWLTNSNGIDNLNLIDIYPYWYVWYEYAVFWSFQTSATIGYGSMTPRNPHEVLYCNFIILINTIFFAFYINVIWLIIGDLQESYTRYTQNWSNLKEYFDTQGINKTLSEKINNFLQEMWINENQDYNQNELYSILSSDLRTELRVSIRGSFFKGLPLFQEINTFTSIWLESVKELACHLEKQKFGSNHRVYQFGEKSTSLYYLIYGKVGLNITRLEVGREINLGNHICAEQFFSDKNYFNDASTLSFCVMWRLSREHFLGCLRKYPHLFFKYCEMKERLLLQAEMGLCNSECLKCKSNTHNYMNCPKMNKWRNKIAKPYYGYKKLERSQNQGRNKFTRKYLKIRKLKGICLKQKDEVDQVFNFQTYRINQNAY